jgi:hypothetical protein
MNQHMLPQGNSKLAEIWLRSLVLELLFGSTKNQNSKKTTALSNVGGMYNNVV